jgi:hypothetical protein
MSILHEQTLYELSVAQGFTNDLAANLTAKGVPASNTEGLDTLVPKVLEIESGGDFDFELLDVPTSGTVTLKRSTEARFKAALTNTSVFTIDLATPTANKVNEYALILQTGASKPTISFPTAVWFPATPNIEVNKTYIILFKQVLNNVGTYDTFGLIL